MGETHEEWFVAENDQADFPQIVDGPFGTYTAAMEALKGLNFPSEYVVLVGDFPGPYNA